MAKRRRLTKITMSSTPIDSNNITSERLGTRNMEGDASQTVQNVSSEATMENEVHPSMQDQESAETIERRRGPTILADVWNQAPQEKWVVKINRYGQPIGEEAGLLASFLGTIGRNPKLAPQGYSDWRLVPKEIKVKCMKMHHCAGRKSFACYRAEKTINGVEPSRAKIFIDMHKDRITKEKKKIDEESARAVELMKNKLDEIPGGVEQNDGQIAWKGDIFDQVISKPERYGQVRGVGLGICPSKLWGGQSSSSQPSNATLSDDVSKEELEKIFEEKMKVLQENHNKELRAMQQKSDMEFKKLLDRQSRLEENISKLISVITEKAESKDMQQVMTI